MGCFARAKAELSVELGGYQVAQAPTVLGMEDTRSDLRDLCLALSTGRRSGDADYVLSSRSFYCGLLKLF